MSKGRRWGREEGIQNVIQKLRGNLLIPAMEVTSDLYSLFPSCFSGPAESGDKCTREGAGLRPSRPWPALEML